MLADIATHLLAFAAGVTFYAVAVPALKAQRAEHAAAARLAAEQAATDAADRALDPYRWG